MIDWIVMGVFLALCPASNHARCSVEMIANAGSRVTTGHLSMCHGLQDRAVCAEGWNINASMVAFRELGLQLHEADPTLDNFVPTPGLFGAANFSCDGTEKSLSECTYDLLHQRCTLHAVVSCTWPPCDCQTPQAIPTTAQECVKQADPEGNDLMPLILGGVSTTCALLVTLVGVAGGWAWSCKKKSKSQSSSINPLNLNSNYSYATHQNQGTETTPEYDYIDTLLNTRTNASYFRTPPTINETPPNSELNSPDYLNLSDAMTAPRTHLNPSYAPTNTTRPASHGSQYATTTYNDTRVPETSSLSRNILTNPSYSRITPTSLSTGPPLPTSPNTQTNPSYSHIIPTSLNITPPPPTNQLFPGPTYFQSNLSNLSHHSDEPLLLPDHTHLLQYQPTTSHLLQHPHEPQLF